MIRLIATDNKSHFTITDFNLGREQKRRLFNMGIYSNDLYERVAGNGSGPIVIKNITSNSNPIAVGRRLAEHIMVSYSKNINEDK